MTAWEDFEAEVAITSRPTGGKCGVHGMLKALDDHARETVKAVLANPSHSNAAIAAVLRKRVGDAAPRAYTVGRHRRGDCSCP